jgi:Domain of unknown function (DUF4440)
MTIHSEDERQILKLFEDGDRALVAANAAELSRIYADDYEQHDECGKSFTKQDVIANLTSRKIRYISMVSTNRCIRLLTENIGIVNGAEDDEIEQDGQRRHVRYIYLDVVIKREDRWQISASQLAKPLVE